MAWIHYHGQMAHGFERGHCGDVEGAAVLVFEGADATLAQYDPVVAFHQHVFGGLQQVFQSCAHTSLDHHGFARLAALGQQAEVLHVARTYLEDVHYVVHQLHTSRVEHL